MSVGESSQESVGLERVQVGVGLDVAVVGADEGLGRVGEVLAVLDGECKFSSELGGLGF